MGKISEFADRVQIYLSEPSRFFEGIRAKSLWRTVGIFLLAGLSSIFFGYLVNFISVLLMPHSFRSLFPIPYGIVGIIFLLVELCLFFIFGSITHFFSKFVFGGVAPYKDTMKVLFYSSLPFMILSFTPVGIFFIIYMAILSTIGLAVVHQISKKKAFFSFVVPLLLLISLIVFVIILLGNVSLEAIQSFSNFGLG